MFAQGIVQCFDTSNTMVYSLFTDFGQSDQCDEYYSPYCLKTDGTVIGNSGFCVSCVQEIGDIGRGVGGSCMCDARTQTCGLQGRCVDYILLDRTCSNDGQCSRTQTAANRLS